MPTVYYLGPEGTHSHEAARLPFGDTARLVPCLSLYDVFERLCAGAKRSGLSAIVPVENSREGPVSQTLDQLITCPEVTVTGCFSIPIRNHLMTPRSIKALTDIRKVYSHPQALGQCRDTLRALLPQADLIPDSSTAAAARHAAQETDSAAIASEAAAKLNRLVIRKRNIQDDNMNRTRFFILKAGARSGRPQTQVNDTRSLIHLVLGNRPGALLHALAPFDAAGINLTFIQSRPLPGRPWEYGFFIEAVTDWQSPVAEAAWRLISALSDSARIIGNYPVS